MDEQELKDQVNAVVEKLKALVREGSVSRVRLERHGDTLLNLPMPAGVVGAIVGLTAAPFATVAGALVTLGMDCEVVVVKSDGTEVNLNHTAVGEKLETVVDTVKETVKEKAHDAFHTDEDTPAGPNEGLAD